MYLYVFICIYMYLYVFSYYYYLMYKYMYFLLKKYSKYEYFFQNLNYCEDQDIQDGVLKI